MADYKDILAELDAIAGADPSWQHDRFFSYVFHAPDEVIELGHEAYRRFSGTNGLDPTVFGSFVRFENDLVRFTRDLVGGDDQVVGSFTSGGTESILLAVKAARDAKREQLDNPRARVNMVLSESAHGAFHKAAHYFDVEVRSLATDDDFRAMPESLMAETDDATALVVASAPQYAHGVVDPITEIAAATSAAGIWLHVDACIGGLILPFLEDAPAFGFDVPGVTSISIDLHKYGYTTKGASIVLYRDALHRRHQFSTAAEWTGYPIVNTTTQSTKSGGPLAAAWAVVRYLGRDGYRDLALRAREATLLLADFITNHPSLELTVAPDATLVSLTVTPDAPTDVFGVAAAMRDRGWHVGPTPSYGGSPAHIHFTMTAHHLDLIDTLTADLDASIREGRTAQPLLDDADGVTPEMLEMVLGQIDLTVDRAAIDATLDALPPPLRAVAIRTAIERLFTP